MIDLKNIDRTRAFTEEEMVEVRKLPDDQWRAAMARPNSAKTMTKEEQLKHYRSVNYPEVKYYSAGGGGTGSLTPPKGKRVF